MYGMCFIIMKLYVSRFAVCVWPLWNMIPGAGMHVPYVGVMMMMNIKYVCALCSRHQTWNENSSHLTSADATHSATFLLFAFKRIPNQLQHSSSSWQLCRSYYTFTNYRYACGLCCAIDSSRNCTKISIFISQISESTTSCLCISYAAINRSAGNSFIIHKSESNIIIDLDSNLCAHTESTLLSRTYFTYSVYWVHISIFPFPSQQHAPRIASTSTVARYDDYGVTMCRNAEYRKAFSPFSY